MLGMEKAAREPYMGTVSVPSITTQIVPLTRLAIRRVALRIDGTVETYLAGGMLPIIA